MSYGIAINFIIHLLLKHQALSYGIVLSWKELFKEKTQLIGYHKSTEDDNNDMGIYCKMLGVTAVSRSKLCLPF